MNDYNYETEGFGLSTEGIHLLRSRYNYETIPFEQINSIQIVRGRIINNWLLVFLVGMSFLLFAIYYTFILIDILNDPYLDFIYANELLMPLFAAALGLSLTIVSFRNGTMMVVHYTRKTKRLSLEGLFQMGYLDSFTQDLRWIMSQAGKPLEVTYQMQPYNELTPRGKFLRKNIARLIIYGSLLVGFYYGCSRWNKIINPPSPTKQEESLPVALLSF